MLYTDFSQMKHMSATNVFYKVEIDTKDESGQLLQAIKDMVGSLNGLLLQVKNATIQLVSTATRITGTAKAQEATIQDFGASTTQIAAAVSQITATSRELLNTMDGVSDSSKETAEMAETRVRSDRWTVTNARGNASE